MLLKIDFTSYKCLGLADIDQRGLQGYATVGRGVSLEHCHPHHSWDFFLQSHYTKIMFMLSSYIADMYDFHFDSPGSVVVKFRIAWEFKEGIRKAPDPVDKDAVRQRLERQLNLNGGTLGTYHVPLGSIRASR
jgi:hypothetical protein